MSRYFLYKPPAHGYSLYTLSCVEEACYINYIPEHFNIFKNEPGLLLLLEFGNIIIEVNKDLVEEFIDQIIVPSSAIYYLNGEFYQKDNKKKIELVKYNEE